MFEVSSIDPVIHRVYDHSRMNDAGFCWRKVFVIDDFIEKEYQEQIKNVLLGSEPFDDIEFPWYFIEDVTAAGDEDSQHRPAMSHQYVEFQDDKDSMSYRG